MISRVCFLVLCVCLSGYYGQCSVISDLEATSLVYGVSARANHYQNTSKTDQPFSLCYKELNDIAVSLANLTRWAVLVHDSSGRPSSGLQFRGTYWLGSKRQCLIHHSSLRLKVSPYLITEELNSKPPFPLSYFVVFAIHNSSVYQTLEWWGEDLVTIGLCLPASCSVSELSPLLSDYLSSFSLAYQRIYNMDLKLYEVKKTEPDESFKETTMYSVYVYTCCLIALLAILGTLYDNLFVSKDAKLAEVEVKAPQSRIHEDLNGNTVSFKEHINKEIKKTDSTNGSESENHSNDFADNLKDDFNNGKEKAAKSSKLHDVIMCFSIAKNNAKIWNMNRGKDVLLPINGWRVLNMFYLIFLHGFMYSIDRNSVMGFVHYQDTENPNYLQQAIITSHISVDSFFCLGGFLLARSFLKNNDIRNMKEKPSLGRCVKDWLNGIWKRFFRLTPPYVFTILLATYMHNLLLPTSIIKISEKLDQNCPNFWWTNILYINNIYPDIGGKCLSWSYYLSNDMQFYIVGSFLLHLAIYRLKTSAAIGLGMIVTSSMFIGYNAYAMNLYPYMHMMSSTVDTFYTLSWMRVGPYFIGIYGAYVLRYHKDTLLNTKIVRYLGWALTLLGGWYALFAPLNVENMNQWEAVLYTSTYRQLWAILTIWFFLTLISKNIWSWLYNFLSLDIWIPLARLCYCTYLLNPIFVYQGIFKAEKELHFDDDALVNNGLGLMIVSFLAAYLLVLFVETPADNLVNVFTKKETSKNSSVPECEQHKTHYVNDELKKKQR